MTSVLNAHAFFVVVDFQVRPRVSISGRWQSFRSPRRPGGRRPILVLLGRGVLLAMVEDKRCGGGGGCDGGGHRVFKPWFVWRFFVNVGGAGICHELLPRLLPSGENNCLRRHYTLCMY